MSHIKRRLDELTRSEYVEICRTIANYSKKNANQAKPRRPMKIITTPPKWLDQS